VYAQDLLCAADLPGQRGEIDHTVDGIARMRMIQLEMQ
jgi:hypothetical protein